MYTMIRPRFLLFAVMLMLVAVEVRAMHCDIGMGISLNCPTSMNDDDKIFCCATEGSIKMPYCCGIGDYMQQNGAIIAGIVVGFIIILIVCTLCCCCFCSCCLLAKRRTNRG